jgi:short-subunit dehydrogenase
MSNILVSLADRWVARRAMQDARASAAVKALGPAVVVTGGSRGIGRALATRFAEAGHDLVLIAREAAPLRAAASEISSATGVRAVSVALDITHADAPRLLDEALEANGLYADILVNNAGVGLSGYFSDHAGHDLERLVSLNVTAATRLMHHALAPMIARGHGGILNVASLGGMVPGPFQAAYYASKAYLVSLTEAVAHEARGRGVRIAVLAPGPVDTTFHKAMKADRALYRTAFPGMAAAAVANSAYRGFRMGRTVIVPGLLPTASAIALKILPHAVSVPLVAALLSPEARVPRSL